jgi:membrane dipeptidase
MNTAASGPVSPLHRRRVFLAAIGSLTLSACVTFRTRPLAPRAIDGLAYLPDDLTDLERAHLHGGIFDVSAGEELTNAAGERRYVRTFQACDVAIDRARTRLEQTPGMTVVRTCAQLRDTHQTLAVLQFQSAEPIGEDLQRVSHFHAKGLRALQITHNYDNAWGGGYLEPRPGGLTVTGIAGLAELNRLRMIPDVAHASEPTALEVARRSRTPFIISHSACRAIVNNPRCASDELIRALADRGGAMGVFMMSMFLTRSDVPTPADFVAHLKHLVKTGGVSVAAIANDYSVAGLKDAASMGNRAAAREYHEWWATSHARGIPGFEQLPAHAVIPEFNSIDRIAVIQQALEQGGFKASEIDRILGGNWLRVFREVLPV